MSNDTSNIDDILMSNTSPSLPHTPEEHYIEQETDESPHEHEAKTLQEPDTEDSTQDSNVDKERTAKNYDDYGNEAPEAKTYTEDEVNERINKAVRDRLSRLKDKEPLQVAPQPHAIDNSSSRNTNEDNWEAQLEQFVEQAVNKMGHRQTQAQLQQQEAQARAEFEGRFVENMGKFKDFEEVVGAQPVTDAMTMALRGMKDPAAFIYAASKRNPDELSRISKLRDPITQMVEMGRLEERMRKAASGTSAPRPMGTNKEDSSIPYKKTTDIDLSIEQLIARADAKKSALMKQRRGR